MYFFLSYIRYFLRFVKYSYVCTSQFYEDIKIKKTCVLDIEPTKSHTKNKKQRIKSEGEKDD